MKKNNNLADIVTLKELGWNSEGYAILNKYGCYTWEKDNTLFEYDPETGKERHCGEGTGCIWTDWR